MALRDMEHDRPRLEQGEIAFFIGRNLPERMERTMRGFLHLSERNKTNAVGLAHFFKCPANAHVTRESLAAIGRAFKGGYGGGHRKGHGDFSFRLNFLLWEWRHSRGHDRGDRHGRDMEPQQTAHRSSATNAQEIRLDLPKDDRTDP